MTPAEKKKIFVQLKALLKKYAKGKVVFHAKPLTPSAIGSKAQAHLYGKRLVAIMGGPVRPTYVAGTIEQKNFVGFYSMALYSHPTKIAVKLPALKRAHKGKSCLNITVLDASILKGLETLLRDSIRLYTKEGWI